MKTDFERFSVGTVFNPLRREVKASPRYTSAIVRYPSRLEAMALDPSKIADNNSLVYPAGQIDFCVNILKEIKVTLLPQKRDITISERTARKPLVLHAAKIMQAALGTNHGLEIDVVNTMDLRHCGLGSSSSLIAGVAAAINELYGKPLDALELSRYCAQNHGEEIDDDPTSLMPVQCIGGSAVCGHFEGGLIILAGQAAPIFRHNLPEDMEVVIGIPKDFDHPDASSLMNAEVDNLEGFRDAGEKHGKEIAYRLVHEAIPGLVDNNLTPCKKLIFDYRWDMGSIRNCSFAYPPMLEIAEHLRDLREDKRVEIIALSSVGPGFFALTHEPQYIEKRFQALGMDTYRTRIHNGTYTVKRSS